jgi:transcriptional regulator with XRE-family HTH domain
MKKPLGTRIRELREARDLSLRELAREVGEVSAAHLSDIELGRRYPSESLLVKLARELKVSAEELQKYDNRAPVEDLKRRAESDPAFGFALRKIVEHDVTAEELMKLLDQKNQRDDKE